MARGCTPCGDRFRVEDRIADGSEGSLGSTCGKERADGSGGVEQHCRSIDSVGGVGRS